MSDREKNEVRDLLFDCEGGSRNVQDGRIPSAGVLCLDRVD